MARIIVASGRPLELNALADMVRATGHEVVGEADTGRKALLFIRDLKPELVIISTDLPMFNAPDFMRRIGALTPKVRTLLYGDAGASLLVQGGFDTGMDGFVGRQESVENLRRAVTAILTGHRYFPHRENPEPMRRKPENVSSPLAVLTEREMTVMAYLARGMGNNKIAEELALSHKTVSAHRSRLMKKLDVGSIIDLAELARRYGLIDVREGSGSDTVHPANLSERESRLLRNLLDGTPIPLHLRDTEGRLMSCNQAFLDLHHITLEAAIGTRLHDLTTIDAATARELEERYSGYVAAGRPVTADRRWTRNGKEISTHFWLTPYRNERGELLGMVCGTIDLTGREELSSLLSLQRDSAEALASSIGHLLEALSDELTTISAHLRTLNREFRIKLGADNDGLDKQTEFAVERAERIAHAVHDLRALQDGSLVLIYAKVSPSAVVRDVLDAVQPAALARHCALTLSSSVDADAPVQLDMERFSKALYLLIVRQLVPCSGGKIDVAVDVRDSTPGSRRLTLEIRQAHTEGSPVRLEAIHEAGAQLAWLLCRRYVEFMRGSLTMDDSKHGGTRVTMSLLVSAA
ncbi:hypothetical protein LMG27952_02683 [Paraburkholderia hiiakae]|uniref:PAS domain S-box-containing protein n=1 Tax=Paraburkholderia hiiakae TaxID=1081782 RepID=A0ABN7HRG2_9BURK|nr:LuxR C-terminal-related transcriptional regulator [Paraburkholderia hiiakae]CAD6532976.1 hypothetical protein LMG27952_02683 [Paraburkholderia hiiakae]